MVFQLGVGDFLLGSFFFFLVGSIFMAQPLYLGFILGGLKFHFSCVLLLQSKPPKVDHTEMSLLRFCVTVVVLADSPVVLIG